jgi:hypothetical protein
MTLRGSYITLQIFNVIAGVLNAYFLVRNIQVGSWMGAISAVSVVVLVWCFIFNWRRMVRYRREEREWAERIGRLTTISLQPLFQLPSAVIAQSELDACYAQKLCPDCIHETLDTTHPITCRNPQCGSRFDRDAKGKWSRLQ